MITPLEVLAILAAGLFAGAAIYVNLAEHPALQHWNRLHAVRSVLGLAAFAIAVGGRAF